MSLHTTFEQRLARISDVAWTLFRVVGGLMFSVHGAQKLFGILGAARPALGSQKWVGGVIELVTGLLIAVGCFTSPAAFLASGTMAVAYTQFHWKLHLDAQLLPIVNKGELALLYALVWLVVATRGAGPYSIDALRRRGG